MIQNAPYKPPQFSFSTTNPFSYPPLLSRTVDKERTPTNDSGILVEAGYKHTPSSSAESFNHVKPAAATPPEPEAPPQPRQHFPVQLEDLEDYVMQRRDNDSKALKAEYKVCGRLGP